MGVALYLVDETTDEDIEDGSSGTEMWMESWRDRELDHINTVYLHGLSKGRTFRIGCQLRSADDNGVAGFIPVLAYRLDMNPYRLWLLCDVGSYQDGFDLHRLNVFAPDRQGLMFGILQGTSEV